jgi:hypothetical protein
MLSPGSTTSPPRLLSVSSTCTVSGSLISFSCAKQIGGEDVAVNLLRPDGTASWAGVVPSSAASKAFTISGTADGTYRLVAYNSADTVEQQVVVSCANTGGTGGGGTNPPPPPPPSQVYGCTDPEADNYDPAATDDDGSCVYTPRLVAAALPELAPLGVPLWASLAATPIPGAVPALATVLIDLSALGSQAGVQLRVDGYLFTSGPLIVPGRFLDADTLLVALLSFPALVAAYTFTQPVPTQVLLTSKVYGLPGLPTVSTSNPVSVLLTTTAGVAQLYSQRPYQWGCFVEIWAGCGMLFGGPVDKTTAVLAQRLPLAYRADNAYQLDIAQALRGFTGHAYPAGNGSCPDRLISYFLRFGEEYSDTATGLRRVRRTYETPVRWGLEAMLVPEPVGGVYVLSSRPSPWRVVSGRRAMAALLTKQADPLALVLRYRLATSRATQDETLSVAADPQQVISYVPSWQFPDGTLSGELRASDDNGTVGAALARIEAQADGVGLTFVNREGGCDTFFFFGNNEETDKRTAATYSNTAGLVNLSADFQAGTKLYSGLLDFDTWNWLRQQLGVTPTVWLETTAGPVRVLLAEVATESDTQKGEYSLAVTLNPPLLRGLSN